MEDKYSSLKNRFDTDEQNTAAIKSMLGSKNNPETGETEDAFSSVNTVYNAITGLTDTTDLTKLEVRSARTDSVANV